MYFLNGRQMRKCELGVCARWIFERPDVACHAKWLALGEWLAGLPRLTYATTQQRNNPAPVISKVCLQTTTPVFELTLGFHCGSMYFHLDFSVAIIPSASRLGSQNPLALRVQLVNPWYYDN
jgi:hypothetical protein